MSLRSLLVFTLATLFMLPDSFLQAEALQRTLRKGTEAAEEKSEKTEKEDKAEEKAADKVKWAEIQLSGLLPEGPSLPGLFGEISESMNRVFTRLDKAAEDDEIDGVVLRIENPMIGIGSVHELRTKILEFRKESGKPVYAFLETALTTDYLLATACDKIYMPEPGLLLMTGLRSEVSFYKNLFDMLDIQADILKVGKYKAAAEPYTRTEMSDAFREELTTLLDDQYELIVEMVGEARNLKSDQVKDAIDNGPHTPSSALERGLIDGIHYQDEIEQLATGDSGAEFTLTKKYGKNKVDTNFDGFSGMMKMMNLMMGVEPGKRKSVKPQVAVIYATGAIMSGRGSAGLFGGDVIGSESLIETIREANENDRVKAIVLRVNSPGGSATASDLIWRALEQVDKPIVVSMGDVAASGGYYISMGADYIYAEPGTITGSIGVVGGKIALEGLFEKLGITTSYVTKGQNSGALSAMQPFNETEREAMQKMMNEIYEIFTRKAAEGRGMKQDRVKELGGGRIYTGRMAVDNGLVDEVGTVDEAVKKAMELADLDDSDEVERLLLPKPTSPFEQLFGPIDAQATAQVDRSVKSLLPAELTLKLQQALQIETLSKTDPRLLLMPFSLQFK